MERCPACNAPLKGRTVCRRCDADLGVLMETEVCAGQHFQAAHEAFLRQDATAMMVHARKAFSKRRTFETRRLLGCAAMLAGDFDLALRVWKLSDI